MMIIIWEKPWNYEVLLEEYGVFISVARYFSVKQLEISSHSGYFFHKFSCLLFPKKKYQHFHARYYLLLRLLRWTFKLIKAFICAGMRWEERRNRRSLEPAWNILKRTKLPRKLKFANCDLTWHSSAHCIQFEWVHNPVDVISRYSKHEEAIKSLLGFIPAEGVKKKIYEFLM